MVSILRVKFRNIREIRMGSPYQVCDISLNTTKQKGYSGCARGSTGRMESLFEREQAYSRNAIDGILINLSLRMLSKAL